jgi:uncharacterized protein YndB with AHSA1/START domain
MRHYQRQIELAAPPTAVYAALATESGLRSWWTQTCDVAEQEGGRSTFRFGPHHKTMRIDRLDPGREVRWHCVDAHIEAPGLRPDSWVGTTIAFQLNPAGTGGTRLAFEHLGLTPEIDCWDLCRAGWDQFLASLQAQVERGQGSPFIPSDGCAATALQESGPTAAPTVTDRIERSILVNAPRERVWQLLSNAESFGRWFGANLDGQTFTPGQVTRGPITIDGFTHVLFEVMVERVEPPSVLAWRWHPYAVDPEVDYSQEEPTLVTWTLEDAPGNATRVKTVESGFDKVPPQRRFEAFRMNSGGWDAQLKNIRLRAEQEN